MRPSLTLDGFTVDGDSECYVIAEIGHNHQGDIEKCKNLFKAAADCGAKSVKLQKRDNAQFFTKEMYNSLYNSENSYAETYGAHREFLEFGIDEYRELKKFAKDIGITLFATAFDMSSADFLADLEMPVYKVASGDLTNIPLIRHIAKIGKPMILSTGGGTMADVQRAYDAVMPINPNICIMQCTSGYPPEWDELNLRVIETYRNAFPDIVIGYSAHDNGVAMPIAAYMLGARIVEKHFTLNRAAKGTDHAFSLEPVGLRKLVRDLRRTRVALGDGLKRPYASEEAPLRKMAKKLVASRHLPAGHVLTERDIVAKAPNDGLPPYEIDKLVGRPLRRAFEPDETFSLEDVG